MGPDHRARRSSRSPTSSWMPGTRSGITISIRAFAGLRKYHEAPSQGFSASGSRALPHCPLLRGSRIRKVFRQRSRRIRRSARWLNDWRPMPMTCAMTISTPQPSSGSRPMSSTRSDAASARSTSDRSAFAATSHLASTAAQPLSAPIGAPRPTLLPLPMARLSATSTSTTPIRGAFPSIQAIISQHASRWRRPSGPARWI
jgi:hypothetical protein